MMRKVGGLILGGLLLAMPMALHADGGPNPADATSKGNAKPGQAEYESGYKALKAGDYKKAIKAFEQVLKADPYHALAYSNMGFSYRKLGQFERSIDLYEKALALEPQLAEAHEYIGEAYLGLGKVSEAEKHLAILEKLDGKLADVLRGEIARQKKS